MPAPSAIITRAAASNPSRRRRLDGRAGSISTTDDGVDEGVASGVGIGVAERPGHPDHRSPDVIATGIAPLGREEFGGDAHAHSDVAAGEPSGLDEGVV
jgi:hypothetical protein